MAPQARIYKLIKKSFLLLITAFLFFIVYQPCSCIAVTTAQEKPAYGDALIVGTIGEPSVLIPMLASDSASHDVAGLVFRGLVKYDTDLTLTGDLAESWDVSEDGLTITFHLKKGVTWEDGTPFTADDVLFGFTTITDPKTPTAYSGDFQQVTKAEVLDRHTFRVTYPKPFAPALGNWGNMVVLPKHLLKDKDITKNSLTRKPVGLGPFSFNHWSSGEKLILEANPAYHAGRPFIDHYIYRFIPDPDTLFLELQAGSVDLMSLTPLQYTRLTDSPFFKQNFQKFKYPSFGYTYLCFNFKHPWFQDKRVRQAIAHAIDKQEIIDGVLLGLGSIATGPYVPNTWPYNPNVHKYPYDLARARELLTEAGWNDTDGDGILDRNGKPFTFTILTNHGNSLRLKTATIIQWRLEMVGIKVDIRVLEWATFINEFVDKRRFQALILGWSIGLDPDQYDIWHSTKTGEKELNFISYKNSKVDRLLEKGRHTFDMEERRRSYFSFQEILADEVPYIFLYVPYALPIVHSRFQNIKAEPIGIRYNIEKWFVPKQLQRHQLTQ
ncbi:MAG: peptide-binding protein [Deltaproteobacteria bacterium]|nr:peptide-binding protein [Deltaproteobacteria bacterium]